MLINSKEDLLKLLSEITDVTVAKQKRPTKLYVHARRDDDFFTNIFPDVFRIRIEANGFDRDRSTIIRNMNRKFSLLNSKLSDYYTYTATISPPMVKVIGKGSSYSAYIGELEFKLKK